MAKSYKKFMDSVEEAAEINAAIADDYTDDYLDVASLVKDAYHESKTYASCEAEDKGLYDESGYHGRGRVPKLSLSLM